MVQPGLEPVAADEITRELGGEVKKTSRGIVVFKLDEVTPDVLKLRTTEDVFLLAWGSDTLTYRADDLNNLRKWTANRPDWNHLFRIHHALRPKTKGKPTFHIVCQMQGEHGYKRHDARDALIQGLAGKVPPGWQPASENAWLEVWLTIHGKTAVCGLRLSDRTMRHRTYKEEHVLASLRPTVAGAMVRLAGVGPGMTVVDPMCGAGTILAETIEVAKRRRARGSRWSAATWTRTPSSSRRRTWRTSARRSWRGGTRAACRWRLTPWTASCRTRPSASNSPARTRSRRCTPPPPPSGTAC
jgi:23S rRNA G2445 N2-methylase RlmL